MGRWDSETLSGGWVGGALKLKIMKNLSVTPQARDVIDEII